MQTKTITHLADLLQAAQFESDSITLFRILFWRNPLGSAIDTPNGDADFQICVASLLQVKASAGVELKFTQPKNDRVERFVNRPPL